VAGDAGPRSQAGLDSYIDTGTATIGSFDADVKWYIEAALIRARIRSSISSQSRFAPVSAACLTTFSFEQPDPGRPSATELLEVGFRPRCLCGEIANDLGHFRCAQRYKVVSLWDKLLPMGAFVANHFA
jgi:hypothetical protein